VQVINLTVYEYHSELRRPQTSSDSSRSPSLSNGVVARRPSSSRSSSSSAASCTGSARRLAVVKERSNPVDSSICATVNPTDHVTTRHVFTSVSYVIELRVIARKTRDTAFLLHYQGRKPSNHFPMKIFISPYNRRTIYNSNTTKNLTKNKPLRNYQKMY